MSVKRARNTQHFIQLVTEALDEFADLRHSAEYDTEEMEAALGFVGPVEKGLRELLAELKAGNHQFAQNDLAFMDIVEKQNDMILPFKYLLRVINQTHREGCEEESGE